MKKFKWNEKLRAYCVAKGLKSKQVEKLTGYTHATVRNWWQGSAKPSDEAKAVLIEKLGLSSDVFEDGELSPSFFKKDMSWNRKFKAYCSLNGWTTEDVAKITGFARITVSYWFRGKNRPSYTNQKVLCEKLGLDISIFYEEDE